MAAHSEPVRLATSADDYARFNLAKGHVEPWEDGLRLDTAAPNIEWRYFDCRLDDGAPAFAGYLHEYHITGAAEDVTAEVRLEGTTQPWRPETGHLLFGAQGETIFAWTPFVPFGKSGSEIDEHTGTPVPDQISFDYRDGGTRYLLTYSRQKTLVSQKLIDFTSGPQKPVAEMIRYPGGYLRFSALVGLDRYEGDELVEHQECPAVFEQMSFAHHIHDEQ